MDFCCRDGHQNLWHGNEILRLRQNVLVWRNYGDYLNRWNGSCLLTDQERHRRASVRQLVADNLPWVPTSSSVPAFPPLENFPQDDSENWIDTEGYSDLLCAPSDHSVCVLTSRGRVICKQHEDKYQQRDCGSRRPNRVQPSLELWQLSRRLRQCICLLDWWGLAVSHAWLHEEHTQ